jgi:DNA-binding transcriptional MerR regulator
MSHDLKIGELAERCGVSRDTLRFYERVGLLDPPRRTASGHRVYDEQAVQRMELIRRNQQIGLTLDDIRELLRIKELPAREACERVSERLSARVEAIDQQLSTLLTYRRRLAADLELCQSAGPGSCPVVQRLMGVAETPAEGRKADA